MFVDDSASHSNSKLMLVRENRCSIKDESNSYRFRIQVVLNSLA